MYHQIDFLEKREEASSLEYSNLNEEEFAERISIRLLSNKRLKSILLESDEQSCVQILIEVKISEEKSRKVEAFLNEKYPHILFLITKKNTYCQQTINTNFSGNYIRKEQESSSYIPFEAAKLFQFVKKNRVAVMEETEAGESQSLFHASVSLWQKEDKRVLPLFFNEQLQSYHEVFAAFYSFLTEIHDTTGLKEQLELLKTTQEKLDLLTSMLHEYCLPIFIFENISSWFDGTGKPLYPYRDVTDWLYKLLGDGGEYVLVSTKNIAGEIARLPRFRKGQESYSLYKSRLFNLLLRSSFAQKELNKPINEQTLFDFFDATQGNQLALELGVWLHLHGYLSLEKLNLHLAQKKKKFRNKFILEEASEVLPKDVLAFYQALSTYRVPVDLSALTLLLPDISEGKVSQFSADLPLISHFQDSDGQQLFYLNPDCQTYFSKLSSHDIEHQLVADWHLSKLNESQRGLAHLKEGYRHAIISGYKEGILKAAAALNMHFFKAGNYPVSHYYGIECYQKFGEDLPQSILNCMALIFKKYKKPEEALFFFKTLHEKQEQEAHHKKHIRVLNYLSMLSFELKNHADYVQYGLKAYKLALKMKETKDIYMLGMSLGRYLYVGGKKEGGLKMMQQSYEIGVSKGYADVGVLEMFLRSMGEM